MATHEQHDIAEMSNSSKFRNTLTGLTAYGSTLQVQTTKYRKAVKLTEISNSDICV